MLRSTIFLAMVVPAIGPRALAGGEMAAFEPVQGFAPGVVTFDDALGKGFDWQKELPCGANRATVTVKFDKSFANGNRAELPVAKVWLHSGHPGDKSEQWIAAVLKAPTDSYGLNAQAWVEKDIGSTNEGPGYAPADLSKPIQIDFGWTQDGVVTVNFGGEYQHQITTDKPITDIGVGGSWAKFDFIDLKVGRSGAPDPACSHVAG